MPSPLRTTIWEWTQAVLLAANLVWTTLCLGGYLAETMVVTASLTATLMLVHGAGYAIGIRRPIHRAGWLFLPFLAYAAANVLWITPVKWRGWFDWFGWAQMIAVFWIVLNGITSRRVDRLLFAVVLALGVAGVFLGCYQRFARPDWLMLGRVQADQYLGRSSGSFGSPNNFAGWLITLLPICGSLVFRRRAGAIERILFGWVTAVLLLGLGLSISRGAWIALGLALTCWPMFHAARSWRCRALIAGVACAGVFAAGLTTYALSPAVRERFTQMGRDRGEVTRPVFWRASLEMARDRPVFGTGAGSFAPLFDRYRPEGFTLAPEWTHNDYLNTLSDYGIAGFGLFFGAVAMVVFHCRRADAGGAIESVAVSEDRRGQRPRGTKRSDLFSDPVVRRALGIGLIAFALHLFVDFHLKLPALAMLSAILGAIAVRRSGWLAPAGSSGTTAVAVAVLFGLGACGTAWGMLPAFCGEAVRRHARASIDRLAQVEVDTPLFRQSIQAARLELDRAVALAPSNAQAWVDRSYAVAQWSRVEPTQMNQLGAAAEADADFAIRLFDGSPEFWVRRGVARDMQQNWAGAGADFTHAMSLGPKSVLPWYHYAYHLSLKASTRPLARAMADVCLRLDPLNLEAQRLRQRLATGQNRP